jgi:predicted nucleic acid-binding protein
VIFIDTGAFIARSIARDAHHRAATEAWREISTTKERCCTSSFVLDETLTLLGRRAGYGFAAREGQRLYASTQLVILRPEQKDEEKALQLFRKSADQKVSFTDCVSFVLMRGQRIRRAFSFDQHFRAAGFDVWPEEGRMSEV